MHRLICWQVWRQQQALGRSCRAEMQLEPEEGASAATLQLVEQARSVSAPPSPSQVLGSCSLCLARQGPADWGTAKPDSVCAQVTPPGFMAWKPWCAPL